ncbi:hypothetical protein RKD45_002245 [Streptomyces griseus]
MTATVAELTGARARQTYYWRVRNARTRHRPESAGQAWHIQAGHPGGAYCDLGHGLDPPSHHAPTLLARSRPTGRRGTSRSSAAGASRASGKAPCTPATGSGTVTTRRWYPPGWINQCAPVLAWSRYRREAHAPPHAGRPRYELRVSRPPSNLGHHPADQRALF